MGAETFTHWTEAVNAHRAFVKASANALTEHGDTGYTGTIAEKSDYIILQYPTTKRFEEYLDKYDLQKALTYWTNDWLATYWQNENDEEYALKDKNGIVVSKEINEKWGPAGCFEVHQHSQNKPNAYLFFGWAST